MQERCDELERLLNGCLDELARRKAAMQDFNSQACKSCFCFRVGPHSHALILFYAYLSYPSAVGGVRKDFTNMKSQGASDLYLESYDQLRVRADFYWLSIKSRCQMQGSD
jgi:hypothetical protein